MGSREQPKPDGSNERLNSPIHHRRHIRIICIGAGASGLLFAYKLQRSFEAFSLTIYEKNEGVSGTWYENKYPGVACDYPAHNYTYSFEPKPDWPSLYVTGSEIRQYFEDFKTKYGLAKYCRFKHQVNRAEWKEETANWRVRIQDLADQNKIINENCDILINAAGVLNKWRWPDIPGLHEFKGPLVHSADWNDTVDLKGKRIGVIGNGASGQQILEAIQPSVGHLTSFIRQGTWIFGPFGPEPPRDYTREEIQTFVENPDLLLELRKKNETRINSAFEYFLSDSKAQADMRAHISHQMREKLQNPALENIIIPSTGVGCRRPTPGINYLETLTAKNVTVVHGDITQITADGCISSSDSGGTLHPLDVLICATGFDTSYVPRFPLIGQQGISLAEQWATHPRAYLAVAAAHFPNYLIFYGPGNPFASGPFLATIECQADYMLKLIDRYQSENIRSFEPKAEAVDELAAHAARILARTVWSEDCRSWYQHHHNTNSSSSSSSSSEKRRHEEDDSAETRLAAAKILTIWPGSGLHYIEAMMDVRYEDWEISYEGGNRFEWLGNGFSRTERDEEADLAWYLGVRDEGGWMSREMRRRALTRKKLRV